MEIVRVIARYRIRLLNNDVSGFCDTKEISYFNNYLTFLDGDQRKTISKPGHVHGFIVPDAFHVAYSSLIAFTSCYSPVQPFEGSALRPSRTRHSEYFPRYANFCVYRHGRLRKKPTIILLCPLYRSVTANDI